MIIHPELKTKRKILWKQGVKKNSWLLDVLNRRLTAVPKKKVNNKYRSHWCKHKKKIVTKLRAGYAAAQPKNKTIFSQSAVCLLPIYYDYDLLFLDKSKHVWCFIDALRSEEQQQQILWWIFFFFKSRKKCCQNTNNTKTLH